MQAWIHARTQSLHTCTHTHACTHMHGCSHARTHACAHKHTHTHTAGMQFQYIIAVCFLFVCCAFYLELCCCWFLSGYLLCVSLYTDGLKELNVFVDLAFISAGEEPMSIQRVNCFHAAATGYAPLIFTETVQGWQQLLKQCKLVFANVAADRNLPQKLVCTDMFTLKIQRIPSGRPD